MRHAVPPVPSALRLLLMAALLVAVAATACGGDDEESEGATPLSHDTVFVLAVDNSFNPGEQQVPVGATVVWENRGRNDHDIVPEDPDAPWAVAEADFGPGDVAEYRFTEPGTYRYYCSIHGTIDVGMPGTLIVE